MSVHSAGLLMCRLNDGVLEYFLVHPGGPFYAKKEDGVWSIPKGVPDPNEELLDAARREFLEETGISATPPFHSIGTAKLKSGKIIHAWTFEGKWDPAVAIVSNTFPLEWPPKSGKFIQVPENDRAEWVQKERAEKMINPAQVIFLTRAAEIYKVSS
jgi:predicted NUDIX family NTP pyrophosphohydrolase